MPSNNSSCRGRSTPIVRAARGIQAAVAVFTAITLPVVILHGRFTARFGGLFLARAVESDARLNAGLLSLQLGGLGPRRLRHLCTALYIV
jgi:hypothetical protein